MLTKIFENFKFVFWNFCWYAWQSALFESCPSRTNFTYTVYIKYICICTYKKIIFILMNLYSCLFPALTAARSTATWCFYILANINCRKNLTHLNKRTFMPCRKSWYYCQIAVTGKTIRFALFQKVSRSFMPWKSPIWWHLWYKHDSMITESRNIINKAKVVCI